MTDAQTEPLHILFVDDEPQVLVGLRRVLLSERAHLHAWFAGSGEDAAALLDRQVFDVVVSDILMPGMDGVQLLERVRIAQPHAVRIALSGHTERRELLRAAGTVHRYLPKPCQPAVLRDTIERAHALAQQLRDPELRRLVGSLGHLPVLPGLYQEILAELDAPGSTAERIGRALERDPGLTAKVLQLVNSPWFGLRATTTDPRRAVVLLGTETVRALLLQTHLFSSAQGRSTGGLDMAGLWLHAQAVASAARRMARGARLSPAESEQAFVAGLLHDMGKVVMATGRPDDYRQVLAGETDSGVETWQQEERVFGGTHAAVGACLLGLWGLPDELVEALAWHHLEPRPGHPLPSLVAGVVQLADRFHHLYLAGGGASPIALQLPAALAPNLDLERAWNEARALFETEPES